MTFDWICEKIWEFGSKTNLFFRSMEKVVILFGRIQ